MEAVGLKRRPGFAVVERDRLPHGAVALEDEEPLDAVRACDAVDAGAVSGRFPVGGYGQALAPGQPAVGAFLQHGRRAAVAERIGHEDRLVVAEQHGRRVAEVLARDAFDDDLSLLVPRQVDGGNRVGDRLGARRRQCERLAHHREADDLHRRPMGPQADAAQRPARVADADHLLAVDQEPDVAPLADHLEHGELVALDELRARPEELRLAPKERAFEKRLARAALEAEVAAAVDDERRGALPQLQEPQLHGDVEIARPDRPAVDEAVVHPSTLQVALGPLPASAFLAHELRHAVPDEDRLRRRLRRGSQAP